MAAKFVLTAQLQLQAPNNVGQVLNQIQSQLRGGVTVNIKANGASNAVQQVNQLAKATQQATTVATQMGQQFGLSLKRFAGFSVATRAVSLFTNNLSNAIQEAIDFQNEVVKLAQVTGKTAEELRGLQQEVTRLSVGLGTSSKDLLDATQILAQAGVQAGDLKIALDALAKTTLAPTFTDVKETAEGVVAIMAQFGTSAKDLKAQLGGINTVSAQFAVESEDIVSAIRRTGGVFKQAGGSLEEFIGLFTSVRATTRESAESIATGLRTIFTRIQRPATIEYLQQFGVQLTDLNGKFVGPYEATKRLSEALSGLGEGDIRFVQIAEELGGFRQIGKVIPLLQQFEVAERARQAAIAGGTSLDKDAAIAQQSLAVQIQKVKEEFAALIRGVADTTTFQLFVKTTLDLASALIKVADSIKPLIPLIATFAAIKFARGAGNFISGIGAGLTGRNQGGAIHAFASGGIVPGTGNGDTVPAMLTPGEFVIRKSSVNKIGADTLAAMNENKYAGGGFVRHYATAGPVLPLTKRERARYVHLNTKNAQKKKLTDGEKVELENLRSRSKIKAEEKAASLKFAVKPGKIGGFILTPPKGQDSTYPFRGTSFQIQKNDQIYSEVLSNSGVKKGEPIDAFLEANNFPEFYPGISGADRSNLERVAKYGQAIEKGVKDGLGASLNSLIDSVKQQQLLDIPPAIDGDESLVASALNNMKADKGMNETMQGYLFEGMITALTGAIAAGGFASFDFPNITKGNKEKLLALFGDPRINEIDLAEAKRSRDAFKNSDSGVVTKTINNIKNNQLGTSITRKMATGGSVSDTVPAMLTPGEFVVNKKAAQSIGYGNLNRMNKQGVVGYAKGGAVQHFADGSSGNGVQNNGNTGINKAYASIILFQGAVTAASSVVEKFGKNADGSSNAIGRIGDSLLSMVTTINGVIFALQAFGVSLNAESIKSIGKFLTGGGISKNLQATVAGKVKGFGSTLQSIGSRGVESSGIKGIFSKSLVDAGTKYKYLSGQIGQAAGSFAKTAGAALGVGLAFKAVTSIIDSYYDHQGKLNKAIEEGDVAQAKEQATLNAGQQSLNKLGYAAITVGAVFGGPLGAGIAAVAVSAAKLANEWFPSLGNSVTHLASFFGGDTLNSIQANAAASALAGKYNKELADNSKSAAEKLKDVESGLISMKDALASGALTANLENAQEAQKAAQEASIANEENKSSKVLGRFGRGLLKVVSLGYAESSEQRNLRIDEENKKRNKEASDRTKQELESLRPQIEASSKEQLLMSGGEISFQDFFNTLPEEVRKEYEKQGINPLIKAYQIQQRAIQENVTFLRALNFGLRDVSANAEATTLSLQRLVASQETGYSKTAESVSVLEAAVTATGSAMNPEDIRRAEENLAQTLSGFGADQTQVNKSVGSIRGLNTAQRLAQPALDELRTAAIRSGTSPEAMKKAFVESFSRQLDQANLAPDIRKQIEDSMSGLEIDETLQNQLSSGNVSGVMEKIFGPLAEKIKKDVLDPQRQRAEQEKILVDLTKQRIALEKSAIEAKKQAIDIELEASKAIEEFGGPKVTGAQKLNALNRQFNFDLGAARIGGIQGAGSPQDLARIQQKIVQKRVAQENASIRGEFSGVQGVENDKRQQLDDAQTELINYTRKRLDLIKEEIETAKQKNELEKKSLEALLSGDIEGFFKQAEASLAQQALQTGNRAALSNLSQEAIGSGFQQLKQFASPSELASAARTAGLTNQQAGIISDQTPEIQRLQAEGRQFSQILSQAGLELANVKQMQVTAQQIVINQANARTPTGFAHGGVVYANRGVFVPRGTDTVPAMLTPGEFVVNRNAVNRGNNLQMLKAMNSGGVSQPAAMSRGGSVGYYADGGSISSATSGLGEIGKYFDVFSSAVDRLLGFNFTVKLDPVNVNVNLTGSMLSQLTEETKSAVLSAVVENIQVQHLGQNRPTQNLERKMGR